VRQKLNDKLYILSRRMRYAGKEDDKLMEFKEYVNKAVGVFIDALPKMKEKMSFKAFDIADMSEDEARNLSDIVLTQFAIQLKEVVPETLELYTYNGTIVRTDKDVTEIWFHAENKVPEKATEVIVPDDVEVMAKAITDDVTLCDVSAMGHLPAEAHLVSRVTYDA